METPIEPGRPSEAEAPASKGSAATCRQVVEHIRVLAIIKPELKLSEIERHVLLLTVWKVPTRPRLNSGQNDSIELASTLPHTYSPVRG